MTKRQQLQVASDAQANQPIDSLLPSLFYGRHHKGTPLDTTCVLFVFLQNRKLIF